MSNEAEAASELHGILGAIATVDEKVNVTDVLYANAELFTDLVKLIEEDKIGREEFDAGIDRALHSVRFFADMFQSMLELRNQVNAFTATKED